MELSRPSLARDMAAKRSEIQKVGRGVTFWGLETRVVEICLKFQLCVAWDVFEKA